MHRAHLRTPLLVDVTGPACRYIAGLTKPARKNWCAAQKTNAGRHFHEVPYDSMLVREFMELWTRQTVSGSRPRWVFGAEYFDGMAEKNWLRLFVVDAGAMPLALFPVEHFGNFMYTQPVLYDKHVHPEIAKFCWFSLMLWACSNPDVEWIDLGGGFHGSWNDFLHNRADPPFAYKWQYVSKKVKNDPTGQSHYFAQRCGCGYKQLVTHPQICPGCSSYGTP